MGADGSSGACDDKGGTDAREEIVSPVFEITLGCVDDSECTTELLLVAED